MIPVDSIEPGTSPKIGMPNNVPNTGTIAINKAVRAGPKTGIEMVNRTTATPPTKIP